MLRSAAGSPAAVAAAAVGLAERSAADTARRLHAAAACAPAAGSWWQRAVDTVGDWRAEVGLGAGESMEQLAGLVLRLSPGRVVGDPAGAAADHAALVTGAHRAVRDPAAAGRALLDLDTWASNPARAVGHLLPDALAAPAGAGLATRTATQAAAARRAAVAGSADAARGRLLAAAAAEGRTLAGTSWARDGVRLGPRDSALVDAYLRAHAGVEPRITGRLQEVSGRLRVRLEQLDQRVKQPDSLKRKLGTQLLTAGSREPALQLLHARHADTLRYTMVVLDADYARQVRAATAELERQGLALHRARNSWAAADGYRGLNTTWSDPDGARFELQFHTPRSWRATVDTHALYELKRQPGTPPAVQRDVQARIAAQYRLAEPPPGALALQTGSILPAPKAPVVPAAVLAATGTQLAGSLPRR